MKRARTSGFTLIELLIVIAIIAILALIAIPNFLEAQTRSKVARVLTDQRTLGTALEAYFVDYNAYPYPKSRSYYIEYAWELTTPVSYITSVNLRDPFNMRPTATNRSYTFENYAGDWGDNVFKTTPVHTVTPPESMMKQQFTLTSDGPTQFRVYMEHYPYYKVYKNDTNNMGSGLPAPIYINMVYDATNGTISKGGIGRGGGEIVSGVFGKE